MENDGLNPRLNGISKLKPLPNPANESYPAVWEDNVAAITAFLKTISWRQTSNKSEMQALVLLLLDYIRTQTETPYPSRLLIQAFDNAGLKFDFVPPPGTPEA